jgi:hypothetical protein
MWWERSDCQLKRRQTADHSRRSTALDLFNRENAKDTHVSSLMPRPPTLDRCGHPPSAYILHILYGVGMAWHGMAYVAATTPAATHQHHVCYPAEVHGASCSMGRYFAQRQAPTDTGPCLDDGLIS